MENGNHSSTVDLNSPNSSSLPPKKPKGGWRSIKYILGNETFEKLASMSLIANITVYLRTKYNMDGILLVNVVSIWYGSSSFTSIAGAVISDTFLGRFRTLLYGSIASFLGMTTMTLTAGILELRPPTCKDQTHCLKAQNWQLGVLFGGLGLIAIGAGGIRPCNIAFGADQFDTTTKKGRAQLESFFNWWYFSFTAALLVALTGVVYIQTNVSWVLGFAIPTACLLLSIVVFLVGHHTYIIMKPQGSVFVDMAKVITAACRKRKLTVKPDSDHSFFDPDMPKTGQQVVKLAHTRKFRFLDKAAMIIDPSELDNQGKAKNGWRLCSLQQVEQLKLLIAMVPVWFTGIGCFLAMDQQNTIGILQAMQMDKSIGPHFKIPPGWMGLSSMIALSIWILIYERVYLPQARKITGKSRRLTMTQRINAGIVMAIFCPLVAAVVEKNRRETALKHRSFESPMSIALLLPQFAISGLIEAFAAVAIMEFLTTQLPESMRTVAGTIFFLSLSIASYVNSIIVNIVHHLTENNGKAPWLGGHDLNEDRLENFYFLIAGLGAVNLIYFNFFARRYVSNNGVASVDKDCHSRERSEEKTVEMAESG